MWNDFYFTQSSSVTDHLLRFDTQFFNVFNHPDFGLPNMVAAGIPASPPPSPVLER